MNVKELVGTDVTQRRVELTSGNRFWVSILRSGATSRHQINSCTVLFGPHLGLSSYQEARLDVQMALSKKLLDISLLDMIAPLYANKVEPEIKRTYRNHWRTELMAAIQEEGDTRLDYKEIRDYMLLRSEDFGYMDQLKSEYQKFEISKPAWVQNSGNWEKVGDEEVYNVGRKAFLEKYLDQVLFDVGLLADND